jgi:hypothetical protein
MTLATLSQLKTQLSFKDSDVQYDTKLGLFLAAGSAWVESYCNRIFSSASYTELLHGNRSNLMNPRQWPITAVTEVRMSSDRNWSDSSTLIAAANYGISTDGTGITYYNGYLPSGYDNVRVIYTAGYATIPQDIQLACLWAAEWFYLHNTRGDSGRTSVGKQGESIGVLADIPPMIKAILQPYKRFELPSSGLAVDHI